jgi:glycyl-tRNA synthetase beta chain
MAKDFLFELGTEELPPTALKGFSVSLVSSLQSGLESLDIGFEKITPFASPRRLAVMITAMDETTPEKEVEVWGPPAKVAFDEEGKPTRAAEAFASKNGLDVGALKEHVKNDGKADKLFCASREGGESVAGLLPGLVSDALDKLPIPKRMRWGASRAEFVRPVHWLVMLFGSDVIDCELFGIKAGNTSYGHRFHANGPLQLASPADYEPTLENHFVIACREKRKQKIVNEVQAVAKAAGASAVIDDDLLDEVTALVEWPVALAGKFDESFLEVPAEALISSMSDHQKYFHMVDEEGNLLAGFITVSNIESKDTRQVISGNERVIRPRLADAAFFFNTDKKTTLESRLDALKAVVFQEKLGTLYDKSQRLSGLSAHIGAQIGATGKITARAGLLAKADLVSDMVLEFDKMQGVAGRYYALNDNEDPGVAQAIEEHYLPKHAGGTLPESMAGCAVALADRMDTLTGIFGIGEKPTGSSDPFALRRAAIGALNIILQKKLDVGLFELLSFAAQQHKGLDIAEVSDAVLEYMLERLRTLYLEKGIKVEVFNAVARKKLGNPLDIDKRISAVDAFSQLPEADSLAAANKRVGNILAKADTKPGTTVDASLLQEAQEQALFNAVEKLDTAVSPLLEKQDYQQALEQLASLRQPVDEFFDHVMVNTDDENIRNNRLALLNRLQGLFLTIADISCLVPEKTGT